MSTTTNQHPSHGEGGDEFANLISGINQSMVDEQLAAAAGSWMAMVAHAGQIRKHAIKQGFGLRAGKRLALAFIAKCLGGDV